MSEDNWQHRSANMRCRTCMYFAEKTAMTGVVVTPDGQAVQAQKLGRCRRHAPTMSGWPVVFPDDWCGDHKLDESKLPPAPIEIEPGRVFLWPEPLV